MTSTPALARLLGGMTLVVGLLAPPAQAATLLVDGAGMLTGADDVNIGGVLHDVRFADGSCEGAYGSCANASFFFRDSASAQAASQALLDQVLINQAPDAFDDQPAAVLGCAGTGPLSGCELNTPFERSAPGTGYFQFSAAHNACSDRGCLGDFKLLRQGLVGDDYGGNANGWAVWSLAASPPVPEPASLALTGLGGLALMMLHRRRQGQSKRR